MEQTGATGVALGLVLGWRDDESLQAMMGKDPHHEPTRIESRGVVSFQPHSSNHSDSNACLGVRVNKSIFAINTSYTIIILLKSQMADSVSVGTSCHCIVSVCSCPLGSKHT